MLNNSFARKMLANGLLATMLLLACFAQTSVLAQQQPPPEWTRALELYEAQNFVAALPLFEQIATTQPDNPMVLSRLGFTIFALAETEKDVDRRQKMRERARRILLKSQSKGDDSNLTQIALDGLSRSGELANFSQVKAADAAMQQGEEAFVRGDLDAALASYKRALQLDPKIYSAAVFAGDSEYKKAYLSKDPEVRKKHFEQAASWFAKAIEIDPNRETAYRYWGDSLKLEGKSDEAREKFVEAIVAEPYSPKSYVGLTQWADDHKISIGHPTIVIPAAASSGNPAGSAQKGGDDPAASVLYGVARSTWMPNKNVASKKFANAYPGESEYRHSLAEEVDALKAVAEWASMQSKEKKGTELSPSLANLIKLKDAGLLEAYILFARVDKDIARDYAAYRISNRDKLKRYWLEIVIPKD